MAILDVIKNAAVRCWFKTYPSSAVGNVDPNIVLLLAQATDAGRELLERANWVNLDTAGKVIGDGVTTLFQLPPDWVRFSPSDKSPRGALVSNKYPLLPLQGPVNTEDLNLLKSLPFSAIRPVWRIIGGALEIWPALALNEVVNFNYYSSFWIIDIARTTPKANFTFDSDLCLISEDTIMKGAVWRWKASQGIDYAEDFRAYESSFVRNAGQQQTERVIETSGKFVQGRNTYFGKITGP